MDRGRDVPFNRVFHEIVIVKTEETREESVEIIYHRPAAFLLHEAAREWEDEWI